MEWKWTSGFNRTLGFRPMDFLHHLFMPVTGSEENRKGPQWSFISTIGNSILAKLTILSPFLAKLLVAIPEPVFIKSLDIAAAHWLYWSLILFFVGQLIFYLKCPENIKAYPNPHENTRVLLQTSTGSDFDEIHFPLICSHFEKYGGDLKIPNLTESALLSTIRGTADENRFVPTETVELQKAQASAIARFFSALKSGQVYEVNWNHVSTVLKKHPRLIDPANNNSDQVDIFHSMLKHWRLEDNWKINLIRHQYETENNKDKKLRYWAFTCYALGSLYFLVHIPWNISKVFFSYF